ncbi:motility associated factor glycosyltransferase family protein [Brachyspira catarrhinii]|uniref:DUF115 domain-containing protein n=1 Tax=Brachyspira catarrhinii TaxID=2528966 RepID=A0ABY2TNR1_9SPIR|nr:6-hydroxymethylpterin diphosphokinase MptE-like protein [Brachyspira catarrhinii]TKZ30417.1 DUF115 domain-containing protein [Brachyspira catarrhinii]
MNNYIKNIEELSKNKYNLRAIQKLKNYQIKNDSYKIKLTKDNLITVIYNDKPLTSAYAPIEEAKRLINQNVKESSSHIGIFLSIASFYHIDYFLSLNEKSEAIIIEKDIEIVKLVFENIESKNLKRVIILLDEKIEDIISFFNFYIAEEDIKKIIYIRHIRAANINAENKNYYDNIHAVLINNIKEKLMSLTSNYYFAPIWARNIIYNLRLNKGYSIKTYKNILNKKIPLLLISAGASIDNYIEKIKELSKTHFILALSHAFNTLIKNDIKADAIVSTDGGFYSSIHIIDSIKNDIPIFTTHTTYPFPLTNIDKSRIFYFSHNESFEKIIYPSDNANNIYFPMEGSVIMPALRIANFLNPKYIILAGCDFCHLNDKSHSIYSNAVALDFLISGKLKTSENLKYKRLNDNQNIECYDNILRKSSASLISYKSHFETLANEIIKETEIFNLTKESAKIENVKIFNNISNDTNKNITINNYIEETINEELFIKKLASFIENINNEIDENFANMISPYHVSALKENKISKEEFKEYIIKWHNEIKIILNKF